MDPDEYQKLAARTECDQEAAKRNYHLPGLLPIRLNHAVLGLSGEIGELAAAVERWLHYGQELDETNIREEIGDCLWYIALACNALGIDLGSVMESNIRKLKERYPKKYDGDRAREDRRDRTAERAALESRLAGDGHHRSSSYICNCASCGNPIHKNNSNGVCTQCYVGSLYA